MKVPSILSLFIAASVSMTASAAVALPSTASSSLHEAAAAPIQVVEHRQHVRQHHRVAPAAQDSYGYYGSSNSSGGEGFDDWSNWSPSHHPGWPCIASGGSDGSETSAYPAWEMKPQCH